MSDTSPLLSVDGLSVNYGRPGQEVFALRNVGFTLTAGENIGIVGELACGKTTLVKALLRLLPKNGRIVNGSVRFFGTDLLKLHAEEMRQVRWNHLSFITQASMNALNPVLSVEWQMTEAIRTHRPETGRQAARDLAAALLERVGLDSGRLRQFPHQFSGGMRQRVVIAMAMALDPEIIIADEPTTALDVIVQAQILETILELQGRSKNALILVTHDMSVVAQTCDRVIVMYGGEIVENGPVKSIFDAPFHPYTMGLRRAFPSISGKKQDLVSIPGSPPILSAVPRGCIFSARCPYATDLCRSEPPKLVSVAPGHWTACHRGNIVGEMRDRSNLRSTWHNLPNVDTEVGST